MSSTVYIDQSASLLRLNLIKGVIDTRQFNVLVEKEISSIWGRLCVGIIGASHYWAFENKEHDAISEVFACGEVVSAAKNIDLSLPEMDHNPLERTFDSFGYSFNHNTVKYNEAKKKLQSLRIQTADTPENFIRMEYEFPRENNYNNCEQHPLTLVLAYQSDNNVSIETAHSYPNDGCVVFTKSLIYGRKS